MKVLLKSDGKTVLFLDYSTTINANDEMWQTLDVEVEIPLIDGRESLWVIFQNVAEPLTLTNETMLTKGEDGHYRILIPDGVIVVPGEWTLQFLTRSYDVSSGTSLERVVSDVYTFTVEDGLPISDGKKVTNATIGALYAAATGAVATAKKAAAEMKESTDKIDALQSGLENTNQRVELNKDNIATNGLQIAELESFVMTELGASLGLTYNPRDHIIQIALLNKQGGLLNSVDFDLPLESVVVSGAYDNETKTVVLTLQNGEKVSFPVGDLVNGLISSTEKGQPNGVATLGVDGKVPKEQLPAGQGGGADLSEALTKNEHGQYVFGENEIICSEITPDHAPYTVMASSGFQSHLEHGLVISNYHALGVTFYYHAPGITFYYPTDKTADDTFAMLSDLEPVKELAENAVQKNTSKTQFNQVYVKGTNGELKLWNMASGVAGAFMVQRHTDGNIKVPLTPANDADATSKAYVDEIDKKITSKVHIPTTVITSMPTNNILMLVANKNAGYSQWASGIIYASPIPHTSPAGLYLVCRDKNGNFSVNQPTAYNHPVRKIDVDYLTDRINDVNTSLSKRIETKIKKIGRGSFQPSAKVIAPKGSLFLINGGSSINFKYYDSSGTEQTYALGALSIVLVPEGDLVTGANTGRTLVATISGLSTKITGLSTNSSMDTWFENTGSSVVEFWGIQSDV